MEGFERRRLIQIRTKLARDLEQIDALLANARPPSRLSRAEGATRATTICRAIRSAGGSVARSELRNLCERHDLPYAAVGALFVGGYLRRSGEEVAVGPRGEKALGPLKKRRGRPPTRK